jgi:hypothetical protein
MGLQHNARKNPPATPAGWGFTPRSQVGASLQAVIDENTGGTPVAHGAIRRYLWDFGMGTQWPQAMGNLQFSQHAHLAT